MGWLSGWRRKSDLIRHLTGPALGEGWQTLAHCCVGNVLWAVVRPPQGETFIACFLLSNAGGDWGYKDQCESMGPYQVSCPLKYLDMAPQPEGEFARGWRDKVRAYHARRRRRLEVGKTYALTGCQVPRVQI